MRSSTIPTLSLFLVLGAGLAGCDQSKAELDSTKQQLTTVTTERDVRRFRVAYLE